MKKLIRGICRTLWYPLAFVVLIGTGFMVVLSHAYILPVTLFNWAHSDDTLRQAYRNESDLWR